MSHAKPIAGYSSRVEACFALGAQGLDTREIATRLGLDTTTVNALITTKLKRMGLLGAREKSLNANGRTIVVSNDVLDALLPHAARRGVTVNRLVRDLLGVLVDDGLVDSVLDDEADLPSHSQQVTA